MRVANLVALGLALIALSLSGLGGLLAWELETEGVEAYYELKKPLTPDQRAQYTQLTRLALLWCTGVPAGVLLVIAYLLYRFLGVPRVTAIGDEGQRHPRREEALQTLVREVIRNRLHGEGSRDPEGHRPQRGKVGPLELDALRLEKLRRFLGLAGCEREFDASQLATAGVPIVLPSSLGMWLGRALGLGLSAMGGSLVLFVLASFVVEPIHRGFQKVGLLPPIDVEKALLFESFVAALLLLAGFGLLGLAGIEARLVEAWRVSRQRAERVAHAFCGGHFALMKTHLRAENTYFCQGMALGILDLWSDAFDSSTRNDWLEAFPELFGSEGRARLLATKEDGGRFRWRWTSEGAANWNLTLELIVLTTVFMSLVLVEVSLVFGFVAAGMELFGLPDSYTGLLRVFVASGGLYFAMFCCLAPLWFVACGVYGIRCFILPEEDSRIGTSA